MADEDTTNLVEGDDTSELDTGTETQEVETEDQQFDEDGNPVEPEPDEDEEVEIDEDLKIKVPKGEAEKLRLATLRQADYTRKTQEVAEMRRAVEAERDSVNQASNAEISAHATVVAIDHQLAQYQSVDWQGWSREDPFAAQEARFAYDTLRENRQQALNQFAGLRQQRTLAQQQESAKRIEESAKALADPDKGIKGWNPEYAAKLLETGVREYGFERAEIEAFEDHRMVRVLDDAAKWRAHLKSQKKVKDTAEGQKVTPVSTLRGASGRAPVSAKTKDFAAFEKLATKK